MADAPKQREVEGTLIRGDDGRVFFIPQEDLDAFEVPREVAEPISELVGKTGADELELDARVASVVAFAGPLGRKDIAAGPTLPTIPGLVAFRDLGLPNQ